MDKFYQHCDPGKEKERTKKLERFGNEAAHGLGRLSCLPEDVLISILNRIQDLKCLFQVTLVSKDFALKTYRIKSISLRLPAFDIDSTQKPIDIFHLSPKMLRSELKKVLHAHPPPSPRQELKCTKFLKFTKFLQKFTELECASFEAPCPQTPCSFPSLNWKVKLGNCTPVVLMSVSVLPKLLHEVTEPESVEEGNEEENDDDEEDEVEADEDVEDDEDEEEEEGEDGEDSEDEEVNEVNGTINNSPKYLAKGCLLSSLMNFAEWFDLMFSLIKHHGALKSVMFTDSCKHGKIVLDDEQIVKWRKMLLCGELSHEAIPKNIIHGWIHSSVPGYQKNWFTMMIFTFSAEDAEEELKILREAHSSCVNIVRW